ncbi:DAK2 domain-containing protein [Natroniella sulfidigena]|uniref:DAK2 domain-containing protein n=1 Tax=Natroniella sulfidigena TaxID=723921 RepID=UPI00200A00C5|nr:DAK2 domain-containing protein [Natroniella sulfidigena]MCK8818150.1 DAK2 domain-containing protein [Natroniella sulfidigena]
MLPKYLEKNIEQIDAADFKQMLIIAGDYLEEAKEDINNLNVFPVPDGDTGTNMSLTLSDAIAELQKSDSDLVGELAEKLAKGALMGARGNSGVILSQLLKGFADGIGDAEVLTSQILAEAFEQAADKAYQAVMKPVEGTILTVAKDVGNKAQQLTEETNLVKFFKGLIKEAEESVKRTPQLLDVLEEAGVVDAGGKGYQTFLTGLLYGMVTEEKVDYQQEGGKEQEVEITEKELEFGYCTEFIIRDATVSINDFRELIADYGDSLLVVEADGILKVHIHTEHPGKVLEAGLKYGELTKIKIDNMAEQHQELQEVEKDRVKEVDEVAEQKEDGLAVLAVAAGEGFKEIFSNLGVGYVLQGGQTMNPSTQDLVEGIEKLTAEQVIILPNNKNIISAAKQVKELTTKEVEVVPTTTIPEGIGAMITFDPDGQLEEVSAEMSDELEFIKTGQITYATRDTKLNQFEINDGDILGLVEGEIELVTSDYNQAVVELVAEMIEDTDSLITVYAGQDVAKKEQEELVADLKEEYSEFDIELYEGGQPIYYYLFSIE